MSDDLISRKSLLECAEYDDKGRLVIPYRKVKNALTAFDKERVVEELMKCSDDPCTLHECGVRSEYCSACMAKKAIELVEKGGIE